jgi:hypothetical protein
MVVDHAKDHAPRGLVNMCWGCHVQQMPVKYRRQSVEPRSHVSFNSPFGTVPSGGLRDFRSLSREREVTPDDFGFEAGFVFMRH